MNDCQSVNKAVKASVEILQPAVLQSNTVGFAGLSVIVRGLSYCLPARVITNLVMYTV